jgi:threonyl-tRNA synthetase
LQHRLTLWDKFKEEQVQKLAAKTPENISITLPDGKEIEGQSWRTTPYEVAHGIRYKKDNFIDYK